MTFKTTIDLNSDDTKIVLSDNDGKELTSEEVEDQVIEAVEEAKDEQDAPTQTEVEDMISDFVEGIVTEVAPEDVVSDEELNDLIMEYTKPKPDRALIRALRKNDTVSKRTCAGCARRRPISMFAKEVRSELCSECEG